MRIYEYDILLGVEDRDLAAVHEVDPRNIVRFDLDDGSQFDLYVRDGKLELRERDGKQLVIIPRVCNDVTIEARR